MGFFLFPPIPSFKSRWIWLFPLMATKLFLLTITSLKGLQRLLLHYFQCQNSGNGIQKISHFFAICTYCDFLSIRQKNKIACKSPSRASHGYFLNYAHGYWNGKQHTFPLAAPLVLQQNYIQIHSPKTRSIVHQRHLPSSLFAFFALLLKIALLNGWIYFFHSLKDTNMFLVYYATQTNHRV